MQKPKLVLAESGLLSTDCPHATAQAGAALAAAARGDAVAPSPVAVELELADLGRSLDFVPEPTRELHRAPLK